MGASVLDDDEVDAIGCIVHFSGSPRAQSVLIKAHWIDMVQSKLCDVSFNAPADDP